MVAGAYVPSCGDKQIDKVSCRFQAHTCPGEVSERNERVMCRVLQQEGSQDLSQAIGGGIQLALRKAYRAHPTREVVLEERREAPTKDEEGRGALGLQRGRSG